MRLNRKISRPIAGGLALLLMILGIVISVPHWDSWGHRWDSWAYRDTYVYVLSAPDGMSFHANQIKKWRWLPGPRGKSDVEISHERYTKSLRAGIKSGFMSIEPPMRRDSDPPAPKNEENAP